jgi:type II secretory pathway pseudopilin PulG
LLSGQVDREEIRVRYLLGKLSEQERVSLEERFFSNDQEFEELEAAETELIDQYLRSELSSADRTQFEKTLIASPRLAKRVQIGNILASRLSAIEHSENLGARQHTLTQKKTSASNLSWWKKLFGPQSSLSPAFAVSLVLILAAGVLVTVVWMKYRDESRRLSAETQQRIELEKQIAELKSRSDQLDQNLQQVIREKEELLAKQSQSGQPDQQPTSLAFFVLTPGSTRGGGGGNNLSISPTTTSVELRLDVDSEEYSRYNASVQTIEGRMIIQAPGLRLDQSQGKTRVRLQVAASLLRPGDYIAKLDGVTESGTSELAHYYSFRVIKR